MHPNSHDSHYSHFTSRRNLSPAHRTPYLEKWVRSFGGGYGQTCGGASGWQNPAWIPSAEPRSRMAVGLPRQQQSGATMRLGTLLFGTVLVLTVTAAGAAPSRTFQVRDSVTMSYFGTLSRSAPADLDDDGLLSPDGRHFVKVTNRGVLPQGASEGTIWIFDTEAVRRCVNHPNLPHSWAAGTLRERELGFSSGLVPSATERPVEENPAKNRAWPLLADYVDWGPPA